MKNLSDETTTPSKKMTLYGNNTKKTNKLKQGIKYPLPEHLSLVLYR